MAQPPAYSRQKNFADDFGNETDHSALNAELDRASNSINDIRSNLAILQADDGKLRPSVVTADSISEELRVSLVGGVVMDAQVMLDRSLAAADASAASAEKAGASETKAAASADAAAVSESRAATVAARVDARADEIVQTASAKAAESAQSATDSAQSAEVSADEAKLHAEVASQRGIPIGTIVMFSAAEPPAGYLKADGSSAGRETYPDLFAAIGTTFGQGDGETTFHLPDLIDRFPQGSYTPGQKVEAGLPNIVGSMSGLGMLRIGEGATSGAIVANKVSAANVYGTSQTAWDSIGINASRSNPIYGASNTVQPPALSLLPCIKAFDAAANPGLVDITALANDVEAISAELAGKIDITERTPAGTVITLASNVTPNGYLLCNGAAISRAVYPELFAAIGTMYGGGDGATTFNLPNYMERWMAGGSPSGQVLAAGLPNVTGSIGGLLMSNWQMHTGAFSVSGQSAGNYGGGSGQAGAYIFDAAASNPIYGASLTVQPPSVSVRFCIKY